MIWNWGKSASNRLSVSLIDAIVFRWVGETILDETLAHLGVRTSQLTSILQYFSTASHHSGYHVCSKPCPTNATASVDLGLN